MVEHIHTGTLQIPPLGRPKSTRSTSASSIPTGNYGPSETPGRTSPMQAFPDFEPPVKSSASPKIDVPPNTIQAISGMATPANGCSGYLITGAGMTTLLIGSTAKPFKVLTELLTSRSPYFRDLFGTRSRRGSLTSVSLPFASGIYSVPQEDALEPPYAGLASSSDATLAFPELNEFAFALFNRWLYGAQLDGPTDFHTMHHYLCLYILALKFRIEKLENEVVDLVRCYYRLADIAAPPYCLEFMYENTASANKMRTFLVMSTAWTVLVQSGMSGVMRDLLLRNSGLAVDVVQALLKLHADGTDPRVGNDCVWHNHVDTRVCRKSI